MAVLKIIHSLCNAHHIREHEAVIEQDKQQSASIDLWLIFLSFGAIVLTSVQVNHCNNPVGAVSNYASKLYFIVL